MDDAPRGEHVQLGVVEKYALRASRYRSDYDHHQRIKIDLPLDIQSPGFMFKRQGLGVLFDLSPQLVNYRVLEFSL